MFADAAHTFHFIHEKIRDGSRHLHCTVLFFSWPAGGNSPGCKRMSSYTEVYLKMTLLLTWFMTLVNSFSMNMSSELSVSGLSKCNMVFTL